MSHPAIEGADSKSEECEVESALDSQETARLASIVHRVPPIKGWRMLRLMQARADITVGRARAVVTYQHIAMATAVLVLMEIQFVPRSLALAAGLGVAAIGVVLFGVRSRPLLWLFPGAMIATALWSNEPAFTILSASAIVTPVILAGVLFKISTPERFLGTLVVWTRIALILSFLLFVLRPDLGAQNDSLHDGAMSGLFAHKNGLARLLVIGVFAEIFATQNNRNRVSWLLLLLVAGYFAQSLSFFALCSVIIISIICLTITFSSNKYISKISIGFSPLILISCAILVSSYGPDVIEDLGRFSEDGDRGRIWAGVLVLFSMRPAGGWGYGDVFRPESEAGQQLFGVIGWYPTAAHNGYMNALAESGWFGLTALGVTLLGTLIVAWRVRTKILWPVVWAVVVLVNNFTDTRTSSIEWFLLAGALLYADAVKRFGQPEADGGNVLLEEPPVSWARKASHWRGRDADPALTSRRHV